MENKRSPWIPIAVLAAAIAGVAIWYFRRSPPAAPAVVQQTPAPAKTADAPLPPPEKSDTQVRKDLGSLSSRPEWAQWLSASDLLDRFVVIVDNVAEDVNPRKQVEFIKVAPLTGEKLDTSRYDTVADVIASIDAKGAAQVVRDLHPLLESAYHKLGYPDRSFDQVAAKALKRIIDAPVLEKAPRLVPKGGANFAYADSKLEALGPVEKLLLRMGPRNTRLIQAKAREIAAALDLRVSQKVQ
jgi:hypothetical protein